MEATESDVWGYTTHHYCLMEKDGIFQWRYLPPFPPESPDGSFSPEFKSQEEATAWHEREHPLSDSHTAIINGWKQV